MIKFSQIPVILKYPVQYRGELSTIHSDIISAVSTLAAQGMEFKTAYLRDVVELINQITYNVLTNTYNEWSKSDPLNFDIIDRDNLSKIHSYLDNMNNLCVAFKDIDWEKDGIVRQIGISIFNNPNQIANNQLAQAISTTNNQNSDTPDIKISEKYESSINIPASPSIVAVPTPKEDLYLNPPTIPRFDTSKVYISNRIDDTVFAIYYSLPMIPTRQTEISMTTDVSKMTRIDLMNLYPNRFIPTRSPLMYSDVDNIWNHNILGLVLPIEGFTQQELIDNIIQYPHIYKLYRKIDNELVTFYSHIEIDGELHKISDVWNTLPDTKYIPFKGDFVKEYVTRRYLLERDIKHIEHKYPMFGALDPYLTLFTTPAQYAELGHNDFENMARACVNARIAFKRTRNPILRRLGVGKIV